MKKMIYTLLIMSTFILFSCIDGNISSNESKKNALKKEKELVWGDEFNYEGLVDSTKWSFDTEGNADGWGNNEYQNYTEAKMKNTFVDGEYLHIVALKEKSDKKEYTSARLISKNKGDWLYGKIEVRAKVPGGIGIWPAIWMLPSDWEYGGWPESGEIDIMEHVGYMPDSVFASIHTKTYNHVIGTQKTKGFYMPDCEKEFHNYIVEWDKKEMRFFVDSTLYFNFKNENTGSNEWPFDKRFYLILNVAVGGNWGAAEGFDENIFPCEMLVDYVRVYK